MSSLQAASCNFAVLAGVQAPAGDLVLFAPAPAAHLAVQMTDGLPQLLFVTLLGGCSACSEFTHV